MQSSETTLNQNCVLYDLYFKSDCDCVLAYCLDPVRNVEFGRRLFLGMHDVFKDYVSAFYAVVMEDDTFDKTELVLILSNVLRSMKYLKDSSQALR